MQRHRKLSFSVFLSLWTFLLFFFFSICGFGVEAAHVLEVYRMFQYEKGTVSFGSQRASVNLPATTPLRSGSLEKYMSLVRYPDVNIDFLEELLARKVGGLLIILPANLSISRQELGKWNEFERSFFKKELSLQFPVYFAIEDPVLKEYYDEIASVSASMDVTNSADVFQLVSVAPEPTALQNVAFTNFQGWLGGLREHTPEGTVQPSPTIIISAYYDTFALAPELAYGADSSASGVVALLELARLFSKLYDNTKTQSKYNLLFLLTSAGRYNFLGTKQWLQTADVRLLETVEFALCLDTIGQGESLHLFASKIPKEGPVKQLFDRFNQTAKELNFPFDIIHKKIDVSASELDWEHEHYPLKKIPAATLSRLPAPSPLLLRSNFFDTKSRLNTTVLQQKIKFIAESLARHIYGIDTANVDIFSDSLAVNSGFVNSWFNALTSYPRAAPYLDSQSVLLSGLSKVLAEYTTDNKNQTFTFEGQEETYTFYGPSKSTLSIYKVKPATFDILLSVGTFGYLFALWALLLGPGEAVHQLKGLLSSGSKKIQKKKQS